jgi:hypothetical protein
LVGWNIGHFPGNKKKKKKEEEEEKIIITTSYTVTPKFSSRYCVPSTASIIEMSCNKYFQ